MAVKGSPRQFNLDVSAWVKKAKGNSLAVVQETIQDLNFEIVTTWHSPGKAGTGFSRGSFFAMIGSVPAGRGAIGADSIARCNIVAANLQLGQIYYMGNTAIYARRLEEGFVGTDSLGRVYNQKGYHTVKGVLARATNIAAAAAQRVASGQAGGRKPGGGGAVADVGIVT